MMFGNAHCMVCRIDTSSEDRLKRIKQLLYNIEDYNSKMPYFNWNINIHCQYGIGHCDKINSISRNIDRLIMEIEPKLVTVVYSDNEKLYYDILQLLRGYFPSVYKQLDILRHKNIDKNI